MEIRTVKVAMTPVQKEVYLIIEEFWKKYEYGPSLREIAYLRGKVGLGNTKRIVDDLEKIGALKPRYKKLKYKYRSATPRHLRYRYLEGW